MKDSNENNFLIKAIRMRSTTVDDPASALEEVKAASTVRSQYFISLLETKSVSGYTLLRFPFLDGVNLLEHLAQKGGVLPENEVVEIGISILRGVADLSRHGVRHQDIKLENIVRTRDGSIKILDFGSARFQKSSFRGSTRTNRSHSAPEQILASKPTNLEALRLTSDERSDVYSAGSVLYQLISGHAPFESNENKLAGQLPPPIERTDVTDGIKRVLNLLLNYHPRFRPQATLAVSFLEKGDVQPPTLNRGGFFYNSSTSLKRLQEIHKDGVQLFDGIILDASKFPYSDIDYIRNGPLTTIIDPQTYLFQAPKLINNKYKKLPYFDLGKSGNDIGIEHISDTEALINSVYNYEISTGADILIPPFFMIKEFTNPSWTFDNDITSSSIETYRNRNLSLPLFKGTAIAENVLSSVTTRGRLIDNLTTTDWLPDISGFYVLLENSQRDGLPNEDWLKAAKELLTALLATGKVVIWGHAYLPALAFAHSGVGLGMGEGITQRSFNLSEDVPSMKITTPHFYVPSIFARVKWPSGHRALLSHGYPQYGAFICSENCCSGIDFNNPPGRGGKDLAIHTMCQLAIQFKKYASAGGANRAKDDIKAAIQIYEEFRTSPIELFRVAIRNEVKPNTGSFLENWLNAFHSD